MAKNVLLTAIGQQIRELRIARGLSQEHLAARAALDRAYYGRVERGEANASILTLAKIAFVLDVAVRDLLPAIDPRVPCPTGRAKSRGE